MGVSGCRGTEPAVFCRPNGWPGPGARRDTTDDRLEVRLQHPASCFGIPARSITVFHFMVSGTRLRILFAAPPGLLTPVLRVILPCHRRVSARASRAESRHSRYRRGHPHSAIRLGRQPEHPSALVWCSTACIGAPGANRSSRRCALPAAMSWRVCSTGSSRARRWPLSGSSAMALAMWCCNTKARGATAPRASACHRWNSCRAWPPWCRARACTDGQDTHAPGLACEGPAALPGSAAGPLPGGLILAARAVLQRG